MEKLMIDYKCTDNNVHEVMEGQEMNVRNKRIMRKRLVKTQFIDAQNVRMERWLPEGISLPITYEFAGSAFGEILVASTPKGVCYLGFTKTDHEARLEDLKRRFPAGKMDEKSSAYKTEIILQMNNPRVQLPVRLHLKGTDFQLIIWKKLLQIPMGGLTTYGQLGGDSKAARAAGSAVGSNPVGFILPCHRVIHRDGSFDSYFWGSELKQRLLMWEAAESAFALV